MYISNENIEETTRRLKRVMSLATMKWYDRPYYFKELPIDHFAFDHDALAMVRDEEAWSYLVPAHSEETENFQVFSFHFEDKLDNSGFIGWLAGIIKTNLGSGVFVICGQNTTKGGIFDYWGCPVQLAPEMHQLLTQLRS